MSDGYTAAMRTWVQAKADRWTRDVDISNGVGARHHVVPAFYLRGFASTSGHLWVRDRNQGTGRAQSHKDLAVRDFYTVINHDGHKDGRMEHLLSILEADTAEVFKRLLTNLRADVPLTVDDRMTLANFVAMQAVRGMRTRRENELLADYHVKMMARGTKREKLLEGLVAVPHPNEHIQLFPMAEPVALHLVQRPVTRVLLDAPLLMTCDEPVLVVNNAHVEHRPECFLTAKQRRVRIRKDRQAHRIGKEIIHIYTTKPSGFPLAEAIILPANPRMALVFGRPDTPARPMVELAGEDAAQFAAEINRRLIDQAFDWVAAHLDHATIRDCELPPVGPVVNVCDGGTPMSRELQKAPWPWRPSVLGRL
ncbi:hypothetical protein Cs7R123_31890 [Catellatospora sp. TT07R-123]|uniref:DUF4238 domain-containing protein n=1 Tax=Catellatospora sp. TT07R-123 TaxID=2733863 RepID=UPI001B2DA8AB|nr:DUF4238 domain-containing protein [Catellatospora sp. TT07R-123]GHJ45847.1 hypothetical protein Cs7R123_31890 [Catellatospora sp. TT07R-123]